MRQHFKEMTKTVRSMHTGHTYCKGADSKSVKQQTHKAEAIFSHLPHKDDITSSSVSLDDGQPAKKREQNSLTSGYTNTVSIWI